ncbi:MAG: hypothetical protein GKR90_19125 [Pseudomonadales bacterium]|nr:hypothetical protein [Pseudomonadales bacterium]
MPTGFHINQDDGLITVSGSEDVDAIEATSTFRSVLEHPEFDPGLPQLIDLRGLSSNAPAAHDFLTLERFLLSTYRPKIEASIAVLVDDELDRFRMAAIFHLTCQLPRTELFDYFDHAIRWLIRNEFVEPIRSIESPH